MLPARIADKIQKNDKTGCWEWTGSRTGGYGKVGWQRRVAVAHRVVYHLLVDDSVPVYPGRNGDAQVLDHTCDNRGCVNPDHLTLTSNRANCVRRTDAKTSEYVGVSWENQTNRWRAQLTIDGKNQPIGRFANERVAAQAVVEHLEHIDPAAARVATERMEAVSGITR